MHDHLENLSKQDATAELLYLQQHNTVKEADLQAQLTEAEMTLHDQSLRSPVNGIDSVPATDFGVLEGRIRQVGSDALPPDPAKQQTHYRYPSMIQLSSQQLRLKNGQRLPLQVGMSLHANIKLRKVTYLQMLLGGFKDKADSLRRI